MHTSSIRSTVNKDSSYILIIYNNYVVYTKRLKINKTFVIGNRYVAYQTYHSFIPVP